MTLRAVIAGVAAAVAALLAVVSIALGWWNGAPAGGLPSGQLTVQTSLTPRAIFFGDPLVAEVDVDANAAAVKPSSVKLVHPTFAPYVETKNATVSRHRAGPDEIVRYRYYLQCVDDACLPYQGPNTVRFPAVTVTATAAAGGQQVTATGKWPLATASSRLQKADIASSIAHFRRPATLPAPAYPVSPALLETLLTAFAVLLAAVAVVLLGREAAGALERRRLGALARLTPLEAALLYLRQAAGRPDPSDRRKALELVAQVLENDGDATLADTAGDVAWAEAPPTPERVAALADEIEGAKVEQA